MAVLEDAGDGSILEAERGEGCPPEAKAKVCMMQNGYYPPRNVQSCRLSEILERRVMRRTSGGTFDGEAHE